MQMTYGDSRFRLTGLFAEKDRQHVPEETDETEEGVLKRQLAEERSSTMGVLSSMLGTKE